MKHEVRRYYDTENAALAAALDDMPMGCTLWIHTDDCAQSAGMDLDCTCEPMAVYGPGEA